MFSQRSAATFLGLDFQSPHQRAIFEFGGNLQDTAISHDETCVVAVAETEEGTPWDKSLRTLAQNRKIQL